MNQCQRMLNIENIFNHDIFKCATNPDIDCPETDSSIANILSVSEECFWRA